MEEAHMQRSGANGLRNGRQCAITVTIDPPATAELQTEESGPKWCEGVQCRRLLGDVAMEGAHVQRRWANGLRNSRPFAITVAIDLPATADLQTEESGPKRCEGGRCRRMLGDVTLEGAHVQEGWANGLRNNGQFAIARP